MNVINSHPQLGNCSRFTPLDMNAFSHDRNNNKDNLAGPHAMQYMRKLLDEAPASDHYVPRGFQPYVMTRDDQQHYNRQVFPPSSSANKLPMLYPERHLSRDHSKPQSTGYSWSNTEVGSLSTTDIEGVQVCCFDVWGEKRINLPQLMRPVLAAFNLDTICTACSVLHIHIQMSNQGQLSLLHSTGVLSTDVDRCGLIRKSDAERLCKYLLHQKHQPADKTSTSFIETDQDNDVGVVPVIHSCFGKQRGRFIARLYQDVDSPCIECTSCCGLYAPSVFVGHTHTTRESVATSHWGFDSANWRRYLRIDSLSGPGHGIDEDGEVEKQQFQLDQLKLRHLSGSQQMSRSKLSNDALGVPFEESWSPQCKVVRPIPKFILSNECSGPLPANLHQGSPVLANPESVVTSCQAKKYDTKFAPNICLAQQPKSMLEDQEISKSADSNFSVTLDSGLLDSAGTKLMRQILHGNLEHDSERNKLLAQFVVLQRTYGAEFSALTKETKRLQQVVYDEKRNHQMTRNQLSEAKRECEESKQQFEKKIEEITSERDHLRRQIRELGCPDVHKTRVKYEAVRSELEQVVGDLKEYKRLYEEVKDDLNRKSSLKRRHSNDSVSSTDKKIKDN